MYELNRIFTIKTKLTRYILKRATTNYGNTLKRGKSLLRNEKSIYNEMVIWLKIRNFIKNGH